MQDKKHGISGAVLKNIALVSMVIDHAAAIILKAYLARNGISSPHSSWLYSYMRHVGRIAFPIYCFLIAQGAAHTSDRKKYMGRLLLLAAVSIVPFSLAVNGIPVSLTGHNVFFTLAAGLCSIILFDCMKKKQISAPLFLVGLLALALLCIAVDTDYTLMGIMLILTFYIFRDSSVKLIMYGAAMFIIGSYLLYFLSRAAGYLEAGYSIADLALKLPALRSYAWSGAKMELWGLAAFPLIACYNGERGRQLPKWVYYWFYPVHLLLFYFVSLHI